jgi:NAD(P)-dependent dehydrogenase (short-subunit alcohol dehydrogenase family)
MGNGDEADVFVITGAGGGMGRACARRLGRRRGHVVLSDLREDLLTPVSQELRSAGVNVQTVVCDVSDRGSVSALAKQAAGAGRIRAIAHTAGVSPAMENWQRVMAIDLLGTELLLKAFLHFANPETVAVCIASMAAYLCPVDPKMDSVLDEPLHPEFMERIAPFVGADGALAYSIAKRGVVRACRRLASQWGDRRARIVSLSPGLIRTPMSDLEFAREPRMKIMLQRTPLGRVGTPEEIAATVDFLCGPEASFITGSDILVDGGCIAAMTNSGSGG